jgi:acyl dehydratase
VDATTPRSFATIEQLAAAVGEPLGTGEWLAIEQDRVDRFADATGDHQWIHVDRERAAAGPYGTTIAHGYLTLSLIPVLRASAFTLEGTSRIVNYGLDRVRFPAPLRVGARVRCHTELVDIREVTGGWQVAVRCTLEADDEDKPVCVADTLARLHM